MLFNEPKLLKSKVLAAMAEVTWIVSVLFNEPKLLKSTQIEAALDAGAGFSALQRAEIAEMNTACEVNRTRCCVSVLFNEPKLLKLFL